MIHRFLLLAITCCLILLMHIQTCGSAIAQTSDDQSFISDGPNIFGVITHEEDIRREDFIDFYSRYGLILISNFDRSFDGLKKQRKDILLLAMLNPYFHWEPAPEKTASDMVLRDQKGRPIRYAGPLYAGMEKDIQPVLMDVRNPRWQKEFLGICRAIVDQAKLDGVIMDTWSSECPPWAFQNHDADQPPKNYDAKKWRRAMMRFTSLARRTLNKNTLFLYNGVNSSPFENQLGDAVFLSHADGASTEAYSIYMRMDKDNASKKYYFDHTVMKIMTHVKKTGKIHLLQVSGDEQNETSRLYALTSYLLVQYDKSYFYYDFGDENQANWFPEWNISLGEALGDFEKKQGVYQREFEKAGVFVNPTEQSVAVPFSKTYKTIRGQVLQSPLKLGPFTGAILVKSFNSKDSHQ